MTLTVYQLANCDTCRKAVKWLKERGYELELIPIRETPPTAEKLAEVIKYSGLPIQKLFNTSGQVYKEMKLKDSLPGMSEKEKLDLLASNGMLIKRPIVIGEGKASVGFNEQTYFDTWGGH